MDSIKFVHEQMLEKKDFPEFRAGDNIEISYKIIEGTKERIQKFRGDVIQMRGKGGTRTFTLRKISNGIGVERIFPFSSPHIVEIKVLKSGKVRRAKLFYLRNLVGKKARIKERKFTKA